MIHYYDDDCSLCSSYTYPIWAVVLLDEADVSDLDLPELGQVDHDGGRQHRQHVAQQHLPPRVHARVRVVVLDRVPATETRID